MAVAVTAISPFLGILNLKPIMSSLLGVLVKSKKVIEIAVHYSHVNDGKQRKLRGGNRYRSSLCSSMVTSMVGSDGEAPINCVLRPAQLFRKSLVEFGRET